MFDPHPGTDGGFDSTGFPYLIAAYKFVRFFLIFIIFTLSLIIARM